MTEKPVDLSNLKPVSLAEIAAGSNRVAFTTRPAPELFEVWWQEQGRALTTGSTRKSAARTAWYACAESLGVYEDMNDGDNDERG